MQRGDRVRFGPVRCCRIYGIDRPDLRFGLEISDISDLAAKTDFKVFTGAMEKTSPMGSGVVKAFRVPGGVEKLTRKMTDGYSEWVKTFGAGGVPIYSWCCTSCLETLDSAGNTGLETLDSA